MMEIEEPQSRLHATIFLVRGATLLAARHFRQVQKYSYKKDALITSSVCAGKSSAISESIIIKLFSRQDPLKKLKKK